MACYMEEGEIPNMFNQPTICHIEPYLSICNNLKTLESMIIVIFQILVSPAVHYLWRPSKFHSPLDIHPFRTGFFVGGKLQFIDFRPETREIPDTQMPSYAPIPTSYSCPINRVISDTKSVKNLAIHLAESSRMSSRPLFRSVRGKE